jgi:hypothetical protein
MSTVAQGLAKQARGRPKQRCGNLEEVLNGPFLKEWWRGIREAAAAGVGRSRAQDHERHLAATVHHPAERLERRRYRATRVRRRHIPQGEGKRRP